VGRKEQSRGYQETQLLAALAEEGCPICHEVAASDDSYFFWFFNENYYEAFTLNGLTRSLGFCVAHAERLVRTAVGSYQLAAVHEVLVRRIRAMLSDHPSGMATYDPCPACRDRQELVARTAFVLADLLEGPSGLGHYATPGLLCFPHLRAVVARVSARTLDSLLTIHEAAMAAAMDSLVELRAELGRSSPDGRQDLVKGLLPSLRLAVGHDTGNGVFPIPDEPRASRRDPVGDFLEVVRRADECPVCQEMRRAWVEWIGWLDGAVPRGVAVDDLLPTCPEHVWPAVHQGGAFLAVAATEAALRTGLGQVRAAFQLHRPPPSPNRERLLLRVRKALWGPSLRLGSAREALARPIRCPVCERLAMAKDRSLLLLFALLEDRQHRSVVENGYGLCLKHFSRALALDPVPPVRAALIESEAAKLARLQWELEESLRKVSWTWRPEAKGAEQTAWKRAVLKFSGSLAREGG
jgi:hypothetical protein